MLSVRLVDPVEGVDRPAQVLEGLLGATGRIYTRGAVCRLEHDGGTPILRVLKPAHLPSLFETVARLVKLVSDGEGGFVEVSTVCTEATGRIILPGFKQYCLDCTTKVYHIPLPLFRLSPYLENGA